LRYELTDYEWAAIKPFLPNKPRGVPRENDRRVLNGIFWGLRSGAHRRVTKEKFERNQQKSPTGKSLLIFRNRVKPQHQKYSSFAVGQISDLNLPVSPDKRGGSRSSRTCGGMRWTRRCL